MLFGKDLMYLPLSLLLLFSPTALTSCHQHNTKYDYLLHIFFIAYLLLLENPFHRVKDL